MFRRIFLIMLLVLIIAYSANAAIIQGTVYDISLDAVDKSIVEINSMPQQRIVAIIGHYSFNLPKGAYTITAKSEDDIAEENITITDDGTYNLDLFLFPSIDEDLAEDVTIEDIITDNQRDYKPYVLFISLAAMFIIGLVIYKFRHKLRKKDEAGKIEEKPPQTEEDFFDDKQKIIDIIKKHGNRTTQKDIRKDISLSEAKVSLIIAELEHENKIKKIKKGRGNIIILNEPASKISTLL